MVTLNFHFLSSEGAVSLERSEFTGFSLEKTLIATRGNFAEDSSRGTFTWTQAVRGLCILILRYKSTQLLTAEESLEAEVAISGERGSVAVSLDSSISKGTRWLIDMFGADAAGTPNIRRLLKRFNPERKRPGPVILRVNSSALEPKNVRIIWDKRELSTQDEFRELLRNLEVTVESRGIDQSVNGPRHSL